MKICAIICEYNPFHNGHLYQLQEAKLLSQADAVLCLMSGNFVQRGEGAILDKFTRAKHALLAGADVVVELPVPFATSNAEIFAKGAINLLSSIPAVSHLCFGAETADKQSFIDTAISLLNETEEVSKAIKASVSRGVSYVKARATAYNNPLLNSPNNILGVEYTKAIIASRSTIKILPIARVGGGYNDTTLQDGFSSASAIRTAVQKGEKQSTITHLPPYVYADLPKKIDDKLDALEKIAILQKDANEIKEVCDCTEGLENALKKAAESNATLIQALTNARYTSSRIRRIALQNLLGIKKADIDAFLSDDLYIYPLGYKRDSKAVLTALSDGKYPLLTSAQAVQNLGETAQKCRELTNFADKTYAVLTGTPYQSKVVIL